MPRFVVEGEWTGYTSAQQRVVHREIITSKRRDALKKLHAIVFADGTSLLISIRVLNAREHVPEIDRYGALIRLAETHGGDRVLVSELRAEMARQP